MIETTPITAPQEGSLIGYIDNLMSKILELFSVSEAWTGFIKFVVLLFCVVGIALFLQWIFKKVFRLIFIKMAKTTSIAFLKYTVRNKVPVMLATIAPYAFVRSALPYLFSDYSSFIRPSIKIVDILFIFAAIRLIMNIAKSFVDGLREKPALKDKPMHSFLQVVQIVLFIIGAIITFAIITSSPISSVLLGLGGASALMMFIFQDSIKGFIGSIQLIFNNMVNLGDWITMNKYGADGTVLDISLTTVKIENFDKTITTVPTNALITDSFQNWSGMTESGGRRFKKSLYIKQDTIRFVTKEELEKYKEIEYLKAYIVKKEQEQSTRNVGANMGLEIGYHRVTNNELFIAYLQAYLEHHPSTMKQYTLLVRQMLPTPNGMEVELYGFTNTPVWAQYEAISTEIFNHAIGSAKHFDLDMFEIGSATDVYPVQMLNGK